MDLAETTLISIQVFNRRRAGEVERILISDFKNYHTINDETSSDLCNALTEENKAIAKKYVRFSIRGKLNRTVPVLLDVHLVECVQIILQYREKVGVSSKNPYVFGIPGYKTKNYKYLRACNLLRKFSLDCGAEHPARLRGTQLRKYIATTCITLNLEEQQVSDLANFMGHAEKIHKDIYRQPLISRDILSMSRLLEKAQGDNDNSDESDQADESEVSTNDTNVIMGKCFNIHFTLNHFIKNIVLGGKKNPKKRQSKFQSPYPKIVRKRWTEKEKEIIHKNFRKSFEQKSLPTMDEIQTVIKANPELKCRTPPQIKTWIHNQYKSDKTLL